MKVQQSVNHAAIEPLAFAVGKLIINCGAIEYESYWWLANLGIAVEDLSDSGFFKGRADAIQEKITAGATAHSAEAVALWSEAKALAHFRNRIAHSPIIFRWNSADESGPPDVLKILDMKRGLRKGDDGMLVSMEEVNRQVNHAAALAQRLRQMRLAMWGSEEWSDGTVP